MSQKYGTQTTSHQELQKINKDAQNHGMTYGQWQAQQYLKSRGQSLHQNEVNIEKSR